MRNDTSTTPAGTVSLQITMSRAQDTARCVSDAELLEAFASGVVAFADRQQVDAGINVVFRNLDYWLRNERFDLVDMFFVNIDTVALQSELVLAPLAITFAAKNKLSQDIRRSYVERARQQLHDLHEPAYADELIARFE